MALVSRDAEESNVELSQLNPAALAHSKWVPPVKLFQSHFALEADSQGCRRCNKEIREVMVEQFLSGTYKAEPALTSRVRALVVSAPWLVLQFGALCVDASIMLFMLRCMSCGPTPRLAAASICVSLTFCGDIAVRIYANGSQVFFSKPWNIFEFLVVSATAIVEVLYCFSSTSPVSIEDRPSSPMRLTLPLRVARLLRLVLLWWRAGQACCSCMRRVTGENKRRYISLEHDFDLDLVYVTEKLISMSVPAFAWPMRFYRNPLPEVVRFFERMHHGQYLIVNLCPELPYPSDCFVTGTVKLFDVQDHHPPLIHEIVEFLNVVKAWILAHASNIVAVHCRGGKGRSGSMCCAWLVYTGEAEDAQDALNYYLLRRTDMDLQGETKVQGVETPSQVRYVQYIEQLLRAQEVSYPMTLHPPVPVSIRLHIVSSEGLFVEEPATELVAVVHDVQARTIVRTSCRSGDDARDTNCATQQNDPGPWDLSGVLVQGDVRISVFGPLKQGSGHEVSLQTSLRLLEQESARPGKHVIAGKEPGCLFYFLFHTSFLQGDQLRIPMRDIDQACKNPRQYNRDGFVSVTFSRA